MPAIPQIRRILFNDEEIGMGFNSESGLAVGTALDGFTVNEDLAAAGQEVLASISLVNSHDELMETIGMSAEAHGRYGFFSASVKASFSESTHYNSTSTFLVARCVVRNALRRGHDFSVQQSAQRLLDSNQTAVFTRAFGDSFVRGLQTGGEFYSVIRITSVSTETQNHLAATMQAAANGLIAAGEVKLAFDKANLNVSTHSESTASMYQKAGAGATIAPAVTVEDVIDRFKKFPAIVGASAFAYETEIATYDTLPLPLPTPEEQEDFLLALSDARTKKLRYIQTRNDLDFALRNPVFFENLPTAEVLTAASTAYTALINAVMAHGIKLSRGEMKPPRLFDPSALSPPLVEPAPIQLKRVAVVPGASLVVPDLRGELNEALGNAMRCVDEGDSLQGCFEKGAFVVVAQGTPAEGSGVREETFEFLRLVKASRRGDVLGFFKSEFPQGPPLESGFLFPSVFTVRDQFPQPGATVTVNASGDPGVVLFMDFLSF